MSRLTDYAENRLVDMLRGQAWALPASLYVGLASASADSGPTELGGTGYARPALSRALATWAGTQGAGTTTASSGTSHTTSNNAAISFGTAGSAWGTATHAVLFDAATAGNPILAVPLPTALVINNGDPVSIAAGALSVSVGLTGGCTDYLANKLIDFIFRGQAFAFPASVYEALYTAAPGNAGGGTEVAGGGYARVAVPCTLEAWAGTQGPGTTTASSGTGGETSNNAAINFPAPTANWGTVTHAGTLDGTGAANLLFYGALSVPKDVYAGGAAPGYDPGGRRIAFA